MRDFIGRILVGLGTLFLIDFGEGVPEKIVIGICIVCIIIGCGLMIVKD